MVSHPREPALEQLEVWMLFFLLEHTVESRSTVCELTWRGQYFKVNNHHSPYSLKDFPQKSNKHKRASYKSHESKWVLNRPSVVVYAMLSIGLLGLTVWALQVENCQVLPLTIFKPEA